MYVFLILRNLLAGYSPFATVRSPGMLYTPSQTDYDSPSSEYDPKGMDHSEITDIGPVFQNRAPYRGDRNL